MGYLEYLDSFDNNKIKLGLERVRELLAILGDPQNDMKFIHVTGTNGKGSTVNYIANILQKSGLKVGIFTSPHLIKVNESIKVTYGADKLNGGSADITDAEFNELIDILRSKISGSELERNLTKFEILTAVALLYYRNKACDIIILEVGLGGLTDATNIIKDTLIAVFTIISLDHTDYMGNSVESITNIKSGIIKPNCTAVTAPQTSDVVYEIIGKRARENNCDEVKVDKNGIINYRYIDGHSVFDYKGYKGLKLKLLGRHQLCNAATAIEVAECLRGFGYNIADSDIISGLYDTFLPCRLEKLGDVRTIFIDGGHNVNCVEAVVEFFKEQYPNRRVHLMFGVLKDKDYARMIELLSTITERAYVVTPNSNRALEPSVAVGIFEKYGITAMAKASVEEGVRACLEESKKTDIILIMGSLYYVGIAKEIILKLEGENV